MVAVAVVRGCESPSSYAAIWKKKRGSRTRAEGRSRPRTRARSSIVPESGGRPNPSVCSQP